MGDSRAFIRHYCAPTTLTDGQQGMWHAEYDGIFAVREFVVCRGGRTLVAPIDLTFHEADHPTDPPVIAGVEPISWHAFELLWAESAQARLNELARECGDTDAYAEVRYFRMPFPAEFKIGEAASEIYVEHAQGVSRRSFEVFADHTLVAPYDMGVPEGDLDEILRAAREGVDGEGEPIDPRLRPVVVSHVAFEARWEQYALPRLRSLAN